VFTTVLLFYAPVMLGLLLWNGLACLLVFRRRRLDPRRCRYLYYLVVLLMLPGLVCDVGGMSPDAAIMLRAAWLFPGSSSWPPLRASPCCCGTASAAGWFRCRC
jgi:hypothetical protein